MSVHATPISAPPAQFEQPTVAEPVVSVVIPCLNEAGSVTQCVETALATLTEADIPGEVIVVDNGSTDGSYELAEAAGALVVHEPRRGYGSAYLAGFASASGTYVVMADADMTYDLREIPRFLAELRDGADMVIGDRMSKIHLGAMPWHHRYIGNPLLSGLLNAFFHAGVRDAHCGMRAFRRDRLDQLQLRATGMEFASEMVVRATRERLRIRQVDIEYLPRDGESKLSSFRDGWRHLRFMLLHSPSHLFILPGAAVATLGALISAMVLGQVDIFGRQWDLHALIGGALLLIVGAQITSLGLCAHAYATYFMDYSERWFDRLRARLRLEHGLMLGSAITCVGVAISAYIATRWVARGLGSLSQERTAILAATLIVLGLQVIFSSFLLSILGLRRDRA
ncbi:MAG TPA: glycosyltransferase family 2 protein [Solirubrobacteraceae bacterium]|nr:glycosyltransferase family 2 protein [Solirubrobacteraceae bacterium]